MISTFQLFNFSAFRQALCALPLAWLWLVLINDLRVEWTVNPQYSYGWAVPFLCVFLLWQRIQKTEGRKQKVETHSSFQLSKFQLSAFQRFSVFALAFLYAPTRLIEEANPGWRLVSWALAIEVVGLTLLFVRLALGASPLRTNRGEGQGEVSSPSSLSAFQRFRISDFVFPVCFFFVAVPWPSLVEMPLIQGLTRLDTAFTTELLGWLGIPAVPHGNVIEVATGMVGIDEACSGIRSFQATLMISLFLGEFYSLGASRRVLCVLAGFALSFLFNLARMSLLVWVAARKGVAAIASWHDPAGVTILVACFFSLWGMGVLLKGKRQKAKGKIEGQEAEGGNENAEKLKPETLKGESRNVGATPHPGPLPERGGEGAAGGNKNAEKLKPETLKGESGNVGATPHPGPLPERGEEGAAGGNENAEKLKVENRNEFLLSVFHISAFSLAAWILLTEMSVEAWYRSHEARVPVAAQWTVAWPVDNPAFKELPLADRTRQILRYDEGRSASWQEDNLTWQAVFLRWKPGRTAIHLAQNHTPEVCMTAAGYTLNAILPQEWFEVNGLRMPFLAYQVTDASRPFFVFYCLWDDRASAQGFETMSLTYGNRLAPVLAGLRNPGQRSLEIAVSGPDNAAEAGAVLRGELQKLVAVAR